jgi:hypothetical protein
LPNGPLEGFVPTVRKSQSASICTGTVIASSSDVKAESIAKLKIRGFKNLDEDRIKIVDAKKYPKYAEVDANTKAKGKGKRGDQV